MATLNKMAWADIQHEYIRVSRHNPCPVCGKGDGCLIHRRGQYVICMHIPSRTRWKLGYMHRLDEEGKAQIIKYQVSKPKPRPKHDEDYWRILQNLLVSNVADEQYQLIAQWLDVSVKALQAIGMGYLTSQCACTFPIRNGLREIVGIQKRFSDNGKECIKGSSVGLFIPKDFMPNSLVYVTEGVTDTMAAFDLGLNVVGKFSAMCGDDDLCTLVDTNVPVHIIADNGEAGLHSSYKLARRLRKRQDAQVVVLPYSSDICDLRSMKSVLGAKKCLHWIFHQ
jgi:hypothetical protein